MSIRLRRLESDYKQIQENFTGNSVIRLLSAEGNPPEKYIFEIKVKGLKEDNDKSTKIIEEHKTEIFLPLDYPQRPPICRMLTPVFHPNINPQKICIGDHWSAGQTLKQLIFRVAEMICYQSYNVKSPLNAAAALWVEKNFARLPLDKTDLAVY